MRKLRWLRKTVQKVTERVPRHVARLVQDWVRGSVVAGSVVLAEIARTLRSDRDGFEAAVERLSRGLGMRNTKSLEQVERKYVRRAGRWTGRGFDVVAIDLSEIVKPYGRKMPFLCTVRDGSKSSDVQAVLGKGWWTVEIVAADDRHRVLPLHRHVFSTEHPEFMSEVKEVRRALERIAPHVHPEAWAVLDRGFDGVNEFALLDEFFAHWCIRQRGDRQVYLPGRERPTRIVTVANAVRCDLLVRVPCVRDGELTWTEERFGYCTVEVPEQASRRYRNKPRCRLRTLIVVERDDPLQPRMMLLVSRPVRTPGEARRWIQAYRRRWAVEEQTRAGKQSVELEDLRVMRWAAVENLVRLSVITEGLIALQQVEAPRRAAWLARRAPIDGEVPPFALYRIWMSVAYLLRGRFAATG